VVRVGARRVREARALYDGSHYLWMAHHKECWECHAGVRDGDPMRYCDAGWQLAKAAQSAYSALAHARGDTRPRERGEQLALF
jgi:hypothetical protein